MKTEKSDVSEGCEPNPTAIFCSQLHRQASVQGHNNKSKIMKQLYMAAGFEAKVVAELSSHP